MPKRNCLFKSKTEGTKKFFVSQQERKIKKSLNKPAKKNLFKSMINEIRK